MALQIRKIDRTSGLGGSRLLRRPKRVGAVVRASKWIWRIEPQIGSSAALGPGRSVRPAARDGSGWTDVLVGLTMSKQHPVEPEPEGEDHKHEN
jgi:hypothetical protein